MRVVHAADLHIDSPLRGLGRIEGAPVDDIRLATRRAFRRLIDLCLDHEAELLLLAGDVFDGEWRDFNTGLFFVRELSRLRESNTRVVMIRGNHDAESVISRHVPLPEHVTTLAADAPETVTFEDLGVAVHGQSYGERSVDENLAQRYPGRRRDLLNIGLLHTNAVGSSDHGNYAPCTVSQLVDHGYDYWALGHVHRREILSEGPWVVYPGNLQGRHARETGPKGCVIVDVDGLQIRRVEARELDVVRWATVVASAAKAQNLDDLLAEVRAGLKGALVGADGRPILARVIVEGATGLHEALAANPEPLEAQIRAIAADLGAIWPEKIRFRTSHPEGEAAIGEHTLLLGALRAELARVAADPEALRDYLGELGPLAASVAPLLDLRLDDPAAIIPRLDELESLLLGKLGAAALEIPR
ncbi:MAG: DNA repair exonuclease [Myxococcales bacterium]|nr:DNA repair exonuclease [Myxococcales bacterium]MCB9566697.1 DNA repair exonuclease [Myxococcales bacterium]MCB9704430.1 DNA repair exonuclease [Myxococcales bacterium]